MHIAICDDNIAERKQTERLMKREADRLGAEGETLYIDSYGNSDELSRTPMIYDAFFIDVRNTPDMNSLKVIEQLRDRGVTAQMCVIYPRDTDPTVPESTIYPEDTLYLGKPLRPEELHSIIAEISKNLMRRVSSIELRNVETTLYITEDELICAEQDGLNTIVTLTGGRTMTIRSSAAALFDEITKEHECFIMPSMNSVLNLEHVERLHMRKAFLADGKTFKIDRQVMEYVKAYMNGSIKA